jgi:hypothetical protein
LGFEPRDRRSDLGGLVRVPFDNQERGGPWREAPRDRGCRRGWRVDDDHVEASSAAAKQGVKPRRGRVETRGLVARSRLSAERQQPRLPCAASQDRVLQQRFAREDLDHAGARIGLAACRAELDKEHFQALPRPVACDIGGDS